MDIDSISMKLLQTSFNAGSRWNWASQRERNERVSFFQNSRRLMTLTRQNSRRLILSKPAHPTTTFAIIASNLFTSDVTQRWILIDGFWTRFYHTDFDLWIWCRFSGLAEPRPSSKFETELAAVGIRILCLSYCHGNFGSRIFETKIRNPTVHRHA